MKLTDHQLALLETVDRVRWGEEDKLDALQYHQLRRALGVGDPVITMELELAVAHLNAHGGTPPPSPPPGSDRSPWMLTWPI